MLLPGIYNREQKIARIDAIYLDLLKFEIGQTIVFEELKARVRRLLSMGDFQRTCKGCPWYSLNICEPILQRILSE